MDSRLSVSVDECVTVLSPPNLSRPASAAQGERHSVFDLPGGSPAQVRSRRDLAMFRKNLPRETRPMCRNIRTLYNFDPPATDAEVRAAALQFVRKVSGFNKPSQANGAAFDRAVDQVASAARTLLDSLVTQAPPRDREIEAAKARERAARRFGTA
jgi:hypothetical protein